MIINYPQAFLNMSALKAKHPVPRDVYLKIGAPGIYIRPDDIEGKIWVLCEHPLTSKLYECWSSTWDYETLKPEQLNLEGLHRQAISMPGLLVVPGDMSSKKAKNLRVV